MTIRSSPMSFFIVVPDKVRETGRSNLITGTPFSVHPRSQLSEGRLNGDFQRLITPNDTVAKYLHGGYPWDSWLTHHPVCGFVVLKTIYNPFYPCRNPNLNDYVPYKKLIDEPLREEEFCTGPMKKSQGRVVPKYPGFYTSDRKDKWLAILLEFGGSTLGPRFTILEEKWKCEEDIRSVQTIHLCGVNHHEINGRHILINEHGEIRLVGSRKSFMQDLRSAQGVRRLLQEASSLRGRFGHESGARLSLDNASSEYWAHLDDPAAFKASFDAGADGRRWCPPEIRRINEKRGGRYTEDGYEIESDDEGSTLRCRHLSVGLMLCSLVPMFPDVQAAWMRMQSPGQQQVQPGFLHGASLVQW
uniref:Protein kinase domain-containing protein n=1 Tax=Kwoniella bestiolae CBS 10118 TaxID=1296100 RepID=A0A1B9GEJ1_9TREE|nr:hypothetical protein I302_00885 [Kwoniella bestiolae CBS 10118]OCF29381.1 hypothetical protein I302_00885 [Kwoniella bestiolae CBS 10118]